MLKATTLSRIARPLPALTAAACLAAALLLVSHAHAVNFEWDGDAEAISGLNTWDAIEVAGGLVTNWSPENFPTSADNIILTGASLAGPQTIDLNGPRQVNAIHVNGVNGTYTFDNTGSGALEIFLAAGTALFNATAQSTLVIDADIEFQSASLLRFNGNPLGGRIIVNGDITTAAASGTTTLELTSRNNGLSEAIQIHGVISDGPTAAMAFVAGFAGDADQHRAEVVLSGLNTYTGITDVNGATLNFNSIANVGGAPNALGQPVLADSIINIGINAGGGNAPGTLKYTGSGHSSDRVINLAGITQGGIIDASGTGALVLSGGITATTNGSKTLTLTGNNTDENTISGVITDVSGGSVFVTKAGTGTWVLTGANQAAGTTNVSGGELILRGAGAAHAVTGAASPFRINNDATFTLEGGTVNATEMDRAAAATFNFKSGTVNLSAGVSTFQAASGSLTIGTDGVGILNLNGTVAQITGGVVIQGPGDELNLTAGSLTTNSLDNSNGGTFNFTGGSVAITAGQITTGAGTLNGTISGTGGVTKAGPGTLTITGLANYTGGTHVQAGTFVFDNQAAGSNSTSNVSPLIVDAGATLINKADDAYGSLAGAGNVQIDSPFGVGSDNASTTFSGTISGNSNFFKNGTGVMTLTGNNAYNGLTTVGNTGTLKLGSGNTLPDGTRVTLSASGAKLDLDDNDEEIGGLSGVAGSQVLLGTATLTTGSNNETLNFDGSITGTGGLTKVGNGNQRLRATNFFTGDVNVNDGTLEIGQSNTIGNNAVIVALGATLRVAGNGESFGSLAGAGTVNAAVNSVNAVNPGFNNTDTTFSGTITGIGGFGKAGTGTMTMTGLSGYTGATRADNGSLTFDGASAGLTSTNSVLLNGGDLTLKNNATINTSGTINLETTTSSLLIESGGVATSFQTNIGLSAGTDASATVTGVGSRMQNSSRTRVGNSGKGTLDVLNGGRVITGERLAIADTGAGSANSAVVIDGFISNGTNGTFGDDDDEVSLVNAAFAVFVGDAATGFLTIQNGGRLTSGTGSNNHSTNTSNIGASAIADGSIATITGDKSRWVHNGHLEMARLGGNATNPVELKVLDGGYAEFSFLQSSTRDGSRSKITVDGANSTLHLRDARGDAGAVSPGFGDIRMVPGGSNGFSEIFVTGGGLVDIDTTLAIGQGTADTAGQAHVTVDGASSTIDVGKELSVGHTGSTGSLTITDGGTVNSGTSNAAVFPTRDSFISRTSGNGTANVGAVAGQDAGHAQATWNVGNDLNIAGNGSAHSSGSGVLNINPTGRVNITNQLTIWDEGTVNLNGGILELDSIAFNDIGDTEGTKPTFNFNTGTLRFTTTPEATLGGVLLSQVLGNNPTLTAGQEIAVDNTAILTGALRNNGGTFTVGEIDAASAANLDFDAGTFNLTQADLAVGNTGIFGSTLIINTNQTINVTNQATVDVSSALVVFGGFSSGGLTNNGDLILADTIGTGKTINGTLTTPAGSTVTVIGTINFTDLVSGAGQFFGPGTANFNGGQVVGDSPAAVRFEGDVGYGATNTLFIEVGGEAPGVEHDQVNVTANVTLDGSLDIALLGGFAPNYFEEFDILTAGTRTGEFDQINGALIDPDMVLAPVYDHNGNTGLTLVAALPGDANLDGTVNGDDLLRWQANLFSGDEFIQGDFNLDGTINGDDLLIWQSHLFDTVSAPVPATAPIPEPGTAVLLLGFGLLGVAPRRRVV